VGRTDVLLSFDTTLTARKTKKKGGGTQMDSKVIS
jgi:hypothetical protein